MEPERPHRTTSINSTTSSTAATTSAASELFICFTSSMKISSKSILSPGRARDSSQISTLSTSLSRRLKTSGSMRGQASPMFGSGGRKRGSSGPGFENPEPSSPKVTCIGQVRVKTKKQGKKIRSAARSKRRSEMSFRQKNRNYGGETGEKRDLGVSNQRSNHNNNNPRWVHFPVTICEALRAFSSEFNCFLPCRSSCTDGEKEDRKTVSSSNNESLGGGTSSSSCGDVFARWLVAVQDGEGKGREIELVVGGGGEEEEEERRRSRRRRHMFEDLEFEEGFKGDKRVEEEGNGGGEARVSVCVPPKNALLLMRCRSDPVKMAALANRFWEPPEPHDEDDEEDREPELNVEEERIEFCERKLSFSKEREEQEAEANFKQRSEEDDEEEKNEIEGHEIRENADIDNHGDGAENGREELEEDELSVVYEPETNEDQGREEEILAEFIRAIDDDIRKEVESETTEHKEDAIEVTNQEREADSEEETQELEAVAAEQESEEGEEENRVVEEKSEPEEPSDPEHDPDPEPTVRDAKPRPGQALPDCLLLMMCEPKLSMEVSKETWVRSTDFIRRLPDRPPAKTSDAGDHTKNNKDNNANTTGSKEQCKHGSAVRTNAKPPRAMNPVLLQPPRSSCSFPIAPPLAVAATQRLAGAQLHAPPFVLTRCKSEPMRSSSTRLMPEPCFWKNRKMEPHRPATVGIGAAGVGF